MDVKKVRDFIKDDLIFNRGLKFYDTANISDYSYEKNLIEATASSDSLKPHTVQIKLDPDKKPISALCSCSGENSAGMCRHIAAVLIHELEQNRTIENPIKDNKESNKEAVIELAAVKENNGHEFDFEKYFFRNKTGLINNILFVLDFADGNDDRKWLIRPAVRHTKKTGEAVRIESYTEGCAAEPCSAAEKQLLFKLRGKNEYGDELKNHVDFLIDMNIRGEIADFFIKDGFNFDPVSFYRIESINVRFSISGIRDEIVYFTPVIKFYAREKQFTMRSGDYFRLVQDGFSFLIICGYGSVLFSNNNETASDLLELFVRRKNVYSYRDIKKLRAVFSDDRHGISISNVLGELRIMDCTPKPYIEIENKQRSVDIGLGFCYDGLDVLYNLEQEYIQAGNDNRCYKAFRRNREFERDVFQFLKLKLKAFSHYDFYRRTFSIPVDVHGFLAEHGENLLDEKIELRLKGSKLKITPGRGHVALKMEEGQDWFDVKAEYRDIQGNINSAYFDWSILSSGLIKTEDSYLIIGEEDIKKIRALMNEGMSEKGELKVSKLHFHFIDEFYKDVINRDQSSLKMARNIGLKLKDLKNIKNYSLPRKFRGVLRDYQYEGYRWLFFLHENNVNGCLADDMGLGKTLQTLAFLLKLKQRKKSGVSLVVAPVNTLANWESEIRRFTPDLDYLLYYGAGREVKNINRYDFLLSSYHTLRNDIEIFREISFNYIILDESQSIKNSNSLLFKTMRILKSNHRLSLTGTPIENSTFELWSQMEFLNPGILGRRVEFSKKFAMPIERQGDTETTEKLKKIIQPFILRRKKEDVASDLPDKSEITIYSRMGEEQSAIYEEHRAFYRDAVMGKIEKDGLENSTIEIFSALLKLRQISLFPGLSDSKFKHVESCKFGQLKDMVDEILREKHKIVIFSQFVKCLENIKRYFIKKKLQHSYIDGSVDAGKRKVEINRFQEDENYRVFLLSLKAGGVGINLTSADYVIIFDPWWNPAVENQAIDRLYRIGQKRKVMAYKMVVKDSVEEKILDLQEKKKKLVNRLITDENGFYKSLEKEDVSRLFEGV